MNMREIETMVVRNKYVTVAAIVALTETETEMMSTRKMTVSSLRGLVLVEPTQALVPLAPGNVTHREVVQEHTLILGAVAKLEDQTGEEEEKVQGHSGRIEAKCIAVSCKIV
jgi:hypothetical protein